MSRLPPEHAAAVRTLVDRLGADPADPDWALTGSASFALQGVPVDPDDVDVQTDADGAYRIQSAFSDRVVDPVSHSEGDRIRSHYGELRIEGVAVEVMGGVETRSDDDAWTGPVDVAEHRRFASLDGRSVPVLSLSYEADAYERLGRDERAALLREHAP